MNQQLLNLINGDSSRYPHQLAEQHPRVLELIIASSQSDAFGAYLQSLLLDDRGNRQGFSSVVISEISTLIQANDERLLGYSLNETDVWGHVKEARHHLEESGTAFNKEGFFAAAERGETMKLVLFLKAGMKINATDHHGKTPLIWASSFGQLPCVGLLLANQAATESQDSGGYTALHWAAANGHAEVIQLLLEHGANANAVSKTGRTPLIQAAARGQRDAVMVLMEAGAYINHQDEEGETALHKALQQGHVHVSEALINHHADVELNNKAQINAYAMGLKHSNIAIRRLLSEKKFISQK
ncbi:ankyrin repeat domain-containing protein [Deefgea tanakiae]|uniref:Ankyrin repeat domain-containing protein n=1 Tax=Deefgea tanakiae TaxID=2865840 RepID=A0ABX8Z5N8_9NEIS|nr:ankyrin repeat domain-containing protein [Deefgea tanakiae]QZA76500.1 ankyrin repeat domain-containing protein [Deefgea tanakiae]